MKIIGWAIGDPAVIEINGLRFSRPPGIPQAGVRPAGRRLTAIVNDEALWLIPQPNG